jgi:hypothetical protein
MAYLLSRLPSWKGKYPTSDTTHFDDLQMRSDIYEHMHRLPRHDAEARAHADYRKEQIHKAAAHHWNGMKAAHAAGNEESAKKHGYMYALALHQLGHKELLNPPPEVLEAAKDPKSEIGHFKAHPGDAFSLPPEEPEEPKRTGNEKQVKDRAAATLAKAEDTPAESEKCSACGGPFHPATGHYHQADVRVCGPCMRHFVDWVKTHTKGKYGHPKSSFYDAAATSIKPGMNKAEVIDYPTTHQLGMEVPEGGSSCAKCKFVSEDLEKCGNEQFREWNGGAELPKPANRYCCDLYAIKGKR